MLRALCVALADVRSVESSDNSRVPYVDRMVLG